MRKEEIEKEEKIRAEAKEQKKIAIGCLSVFGAIIGLIIFFVIIFTFVGNNGDNKKEVRKVNPTCLEAYIISQTYVEKILKSPSTAEFGDYKCMGKYPTYIVRSEVDSQNSFGAMIRNTYIVNTDYMGGEWSEIQNWQLNILVFDGKVVIDNK